MYKGRYTRLVRCNVNGKVWYDVWVAEQLFRFKPYSLNSFTFRYLWETGDSCVVAKAINLNGDCQKAHALMNFKQFISITLQMPLSDVDKRCLVAVLRAALEEMWDLGHWGQDDGEQSHEGPYYHRVEELIEAAEQQHETISAGLSWEGVCPQKDKSNVRLIALTLFWTKCLSFCFEASQSSAISESVQRDTETWLKLFLMMLSKVSQYCDPRNMALNSNWGIVRWLLLCETSWIWNQWGSMGKIPIDT